MDVLWLTSATLLENTAPIGESLVIQSADPKGPHWNEGAKHFIKGVVIHVASANRHPHRRNLVTVRELLKKALWVEPQDEDADEKTARAKRRPTLFLGNDENRRGARERTGNRQHRQPSE